MNRRKFLASSASLPFAARSGLLGAQSAVPEQARLHYQKSNLAEPAGKPNLDRYHHTLNRVLHGPQPAYTQEFLLEDVRGEPGRRFTNFSGDLSGRWIGALAASSASFGEEFSTLDEFVKEALPLQHPQGYFGK